MKDYKFAFNGKLVGAIGVSNGHVKEIQSDSLENAILKLYDTHEHISRLHFWDGEKYVPYVIKGENPARNI
jgi:hypothetical protein